MKEGSPPERTKRTGNDPNVPYLLEGKAGLVITDG